MIGGKLDGAGPPAGCLRAASNWRYNEFLHQVTWECYVLVEPCELVPDGRQ